MRKSFDRTGDPAPPADLKTRLTAALQRHHAASPANMGELVQVGFLTATGMGEKGVAGTMGITPKRVKTLQKTVFDATGGSEGLARMAEQAQAAVDAFRPAAMPASRSTLAQPVPRQTRAPVPRVCPLAQEKGKKFMTQEEGMAMMPSDRHRAVLGLILDGYRYNEIDEAMNLRRGSAEGAANDILHILKVKGGRVDICAKFGIKLNPDGILITTAARSSGAPDSPVPHR